MDPNSTLQMIADCLNATESGDTSAGEPLDDACQALWDWIRIGGFEPSWHDHELASSYYRCRAVHHDRGEFLPE